MPTAARKGHSHILRKIHALFTCVYVVAQVHADLMLGRGEAVGAGGLRGITLGYPYTPSDTRTPPPYEG